MLDFLKRKKQPKEVPNISTSHFSSRVRTHSSLGRSLTSIEQAKAELYKEPRTLDPRSFVGRFKGYEFFGLDHFTSEPSPIYLPASAINHILFCGITRSGKGVLAGVKAFEAISQRKGLIYLDVKQEDFTPRIIQEALKEQGREDDFLLVNWPQDFGYSGLNKTDSLIELHEKICVALELEPDPDGAVDHYRKVERMTLYRLLEVGLEYRIIQKEWYQILDFIWALKEDFEAHRLYEKELLKSKPNFNEIEKNSMRFFEKYVIEELGFSDANIAALEYLYIKLFELLNGANIHNRYSIEEALYKGKVLYIKADMLNLSSLRFLKLLFVDIAQQVRKRKADTLLIADEISFYASHHLAGMLSTMAGFGLRMILQLQDLAQLGDERLKNAILTNCSVKLFYKISDLETLQYVEKLGGVEPITKYSERGTDKIISQDTEPLLNSTRIRAMWFQKNAILIAEYLNTAVFIQTSHISVSHLFEWRKTQKKQTSVKRVFFRKTIKIEAMKKINEFDLDAL